MKKRKSEFVTGKKYSKDEVFYHHGYTAIPEIVEEPAVDPGRLGWDIETNNLVVMPDESESAQESKLWDQRGIKS